jgi:hypothetical protein
MLLDPTPIHELVRYSIEEYSSPDKRVKILLHLSMIPI